MMFNSSSELVLYRPVGETFSNDRLDKRKDRRKSASQTRRVILINSFPDYTRVLIRVAEHSDTPRVVYHSYVHMYTGRRHVASQTKAGLTDCNKLPSLQKTFQNPPKDKKIH